MVSAVDRAKRALVTLLKLLATAYGCVADVTRDSTDLEIKSAYRKLSKRVHPDKGGDKHRFELVQKAYAVRFFFCCRA